MLRSFVSMFLGAIRVMRRDTSHQCRVVCPSQCSLLDVVEQLAQRFGEYDPESKMYVRLHRREGPKASVKVLVGGRSCEHCQHCEAYELVNELLGCQAQHGPKAGWAADEMRRRAQMIRRRGGV